MRGGRDTAASVTQASARDIIPRAESGPALGSMASGPGARSVGAMNQHAVTLRTSQALLAFMGAVVCFGSIYFRAIKTHRLTTISSIRFQLT